MTGELLRADVLNGADTRGRDSDFARMGLGVVDEFRKAIDRKRLPHDEHVRRLHRECDRLEALHRIPAENGKQRGIGLVRARVRTTERSVGKEGVSTSRYRG